MTFLYDAGVLVAADRNDREVWADHRSRLERGIVPTTTATVVAQVSRSAKQASLRRFLKSCFIREFSEADAHEVGALLAAARTSDVVDAHVAIVAAKLGLSVLTTDPADLSHLVAHLDSAVVVIDV